MKLDAIAYPVKILKHVFCKDSICIAINPGSPRVTYDFKRFNSVLNLVQACASSGQHNYDCKYAIIQDANEVELYVTVTPESIDISQQIPKHLLIMLLGHVNA